MWTALQHYRALEPELRKLFWRAVVLESCLSLSLWFYGFNRTKESLQRVLPATLPISVDSESARQTVQKTCRMVSAAARYGMVRPTCLVESLALWHLLRLQHISASLRIGVRKVAQKFEAHAWVEYEGAALNQAGQQHRHYSAFDASFSDLPGESS